jgi:predicted nucleic acid-binding protein
MTIPAKYERGVFRPLQDISWTVSQSHGRCRRLLPCRPAQREHWSNSLWLLKTYAKSHGLHVFDALVAATAIERAHTLITLNRKHYQMIEGLLLQVPDY